MATTDTTVSNLIINKLTQAQYDSIQTRSDTELYLVEEVVDSTPTSGSTNYVTSDGIYTALSSKQNNLESQTAYTSKGTSTKVPQITTNSLGQVTDITEITIEQPDITGKADKVSSAVEGNFASLDSNGNLEDSGYSYTDCLNELSDQYTPATESSELEPGDTYEEAFGKLEKTITDNEYITAQALNDLNTNKQDTLESGINIKTINGESILGDGNFNVTGDCIAYPTFSIDNNGHLIMRGGDPRLFEIVNGHLIYTYQ